MNARQFVSDALDAAGMDHIDAPHDLFQHVANECVDHEDFRRLLGKLPQDKRRRAYDALVPRLRFQAKPLDVYASEWGAIAEAKQLPTVDAKGNFVPFRAPEIGSLEYSLQQATLREMAKVTLHVTCRRCTKAGEFYGERKADAIFELRKAGWQYDELNGEGREICPEC